MGGFDAQRFKKWDEGVKEHRGGDATLPFAGDLLIELGAEFLDGANYSDEGCGRGELTQMERNELYALCRAAWHIVEGARHRRTHGLDDPDNG